MTPRVLAEVPTLDAIAADPAKAAALPRRALLDLAARALHVHATVTTALIAVASEPAVDDGDRLLNTREAARLLDRTTSWVYRHADVLPFTVRREGEHPRFSFRGLQAYISRQVAEQAAGKGA